jgi:hypothetical protein
MKSVFIALIIFLGFHNLAHSQNLVGSYQHYKSRVMGGYRISSTSNLEISKSTNQSLNYVVRTTITDEYSGGIPKTQETSGVLKLIDNKYRFIGGSYGERGAYILLNNKANANIQVYFAPNRGDVMNFERN